MLQGLLFHPGGIYFRCQHHDHGRASQLLISHWLSHLRIDKLKTHLGNGVGFFIESAMNLIQSVSQSQSQIIHAIIGFLNIGIADMPVSERKTDAFLGVSNTNAHFI